MFDESPDAKIARIDERTLRMEAKLDGFITAHNEQMKDSKQEIDSLKEWKSRLIGGYTVLLGLFGLHVSRG